MNEGELNSNKDFSPLCMDSADCEGDVVDDDAEEPEEVISVFRLKLLKAQLQSDASLVVQVNQGLEEFTNQVEKNMEDNESTIHEMDDAIDKISTWRFNQDKYIEDNNYPNLGPETDAEVEGKQVTSHLIRLADEIMSMAPIAQAAVPNLCSSHADDLQRTLDDMKRNNANSGSESDDDDDAGYDYSAVSGRQQNNHKAALDVDFERIDYESGLACKEQSLKLQQELLLQELEYERSINSLVHKLERMNKGLDAALSYSPT